MQQLQSVLRLQLLLDMFQEAMLAALRLVAASCTKLCPLRARRAVPTIAHMQAPATWSGVLWELQQQQAFRQGSNAEAGALSLHSHGLCAGGKAALVQRA